MKMNKVILSMVAAGVLAGCQSVPVVEEKVELVSEWSHRPIIDELQELPAVVPELIDSGLVKAPIKEVVTSPEVDSGWFDWVGNDKQQDWFAGSEAKTAVVDAKEESVSVSTKVASEPSKEESVSVATKVASGPSKEESVSVTAKVVSEPSKEDEVEFKRFNEQLREGVEASYIAQSSTYILDQSEVFEFLAYKGETYNSVLSRWLNDQGFDVVGWYLDSIPEAMLSNQLEDSFQIDMTFDDAITHLFASMREHDVNVDHLEISSSDVEGQFIEVRLDGGKSQAVVTSKIMPTTVFMVEPGSLKQNFIRLGEHFDWTVSDEFYLARDYKVSFGFPIVAEKGNVKSALEQMLKPFSSLRGAIVPSVHEIYVVQERN